MCYLPLHASDCDCGDTNHQYCESGCRTILCLEPQGYPPELCHADYPRAAFINVDGHGFCSDCAPEAIRAQGEAGTPVNA
jgi:hypothetical protein